MDSQVTIGLPVYKAEAYLGKCLESIRAQTLTDFKIVAIVDGPNAECERILQSTNDPRLSYSVNPVNLGITKTANLLLEKTTTPYFARMDSDDIMMPERLAVQLEYLQSHPECDILGSHFDYIDPQDTIVGTEEDWPWSHEEILARFKIHNAILNPSAMFRTESIKNIGGYDEQFLNAEDLALWLKALARGLKFANLPQKLIYYRLHNIQATQAREESDLSFCDMAYAEFGREIWGDGAPDYVAGRTKMQRLRRRIRRNIKNIFS